MASSVTPSRMCILSTQRVLIGLCGVAPGVQVRGVDGGSVMVLAALGSLQVEWRLGGGGLEVRSLQSSKG